MKMLPEKTLLPARFSRLGMMFARQLLVKPWETTRFPAEPSNCRVDAAFAPELLRIIKPLAFAKAALVVTRTAPSLALVLPLSRNRTPESGLLPESTSVPGPLLVKPLVPATGSESVAVFVTMRGGDDALSFSVSVLPPALVMIQL